MGADLIGNFPAPAALAVDAQGQLYSGTADGQIYRIVVEANDHKRIEPFARTGGQPLGLAFDRQGRLIVADARRGLLAIDPSSNVQILTDRAGNRSLNRVSSLAIARDGRIYFCEQSDHPPSFDPYLELLEARPSGRLLVYDPRTNTVRVLLEHLAFPAGTVLSLDERAVLINEATHYQIIRYWLAGPKAGTSDAFIQNLPGFPAGLSRDRTGYWLAISEPRNANIDNLAPQPALKNLLAKLPASWVRGNEKGYGLVLRLDAQGQIRESLQDPTGRLNHLSTVLPAPPFLYLGTTAENGIARVRLSSHSGT